jgi:hypothetical protein
MTYSKFADSAAGGPLEFFIDGDRKSPYEYCIHIRFEKDRGYDSTTCHKNFHPDQRETRQIIISKDGWEFQINLSMFFGYEHSRLISIQ